RTHRRHGHARHHDHHQSAGADVRDAHLRTTPDLGNGRPRLVSHGVLALRRGAGEPANEDHRSSEGRARRRRSRGSLESDYLPFEEPPIFLPVVPFFAARLAAFASVACADSASAPAFLPPRRRSAAARSRPPTPPLAFGFSVSPSLASLS